MSRETFKGRLCGINLGESGGEKIVDYKLNEEEQGLFNKSADAVRGMNEVLANS